MHLEWTSDPRAFVAQDWTELVEADPEGTFFHTPRYLKLYWEEFARGSLHLAFVREGDELVAACGFEIDEGHLTFLGGFDVTDYAGPVGRPSVRELAAKELLTGLAAIEDWDRAGLCGLLRDGAWTSALATAADAVGLRSRVEDGGTAPFLELPGDYDAYLAALHAKRRHELRRKARRMTERLGPPKLVEATPETAGADLDLFVAWHRASEGSKGRFMVPGMELFFRRLADEALPDGTFRLSFLEVAGRRLAGAIGFRDRRRFLLYNSAYDHSARELAPGMVLVSELIRDAITHRCEGFDFLTGDLPYKYRFGARPRKLAKLVLERP